MFEIDVKGLAQIEGGRPAHRLALEPIVNVFDEFRGYDRREYLTPQQPSYCAVTLKHSANPRGVWLTVDDDGAGFKRIEDVWTLFGETDKRRSAAVSGRFNAGDKQLIATARIATVRSREHSVRFENGQRTHARVHPAKAYGGVEARFLMPWTKSDMSLIRQHLRFLIPPTGLRYTVDGELVELPQVKYKATVTIPTVVLIDDALRPTQRKTAVNVLEIDASTLRDVPTLYELGIPVCSLADVGFPYSLDVQQKVPVPMSRDSVSPAYLFRLIGTVLEQAAMDGRQLLTTEQEGAGFVKQALDWVREPAALQATITALHGDNAVRLTNDPLANAKAAAGGASLVSGRQYTPETRQRMEAHNILPTSISVYGGTERALQDSAEDNEGLKPCPDCGGSGRVKK